MLDSPIFVVGTPRSGTTLTAKLFGNHKSIFMPGETHFFDDIYSRRRVLGNPSDPTGMEKIIQQLLTIYGRFNELIDQTRINQLSKTSEFLEVLRSAKSYAGLYRRFMEFQMYHEGKERWGNQVPRDLFEIDEIFEFFPKAKIVACVRDPRDFLVSYRDFWKRWTGWESERLKNIYHPVITSLLWKSSMIFLKKKLNQYGSKIILNHYEDLVNNPENQVRTLCAFVEVNFDPMMLLTNFNNSSTNFIGNGIYPTSVKSWRRKLGKSDAFLAQQICQQEMVSMGYTIEKVIPNPILVAGSVLSTPYCACRALLMNKSKRGPLLPYLAKRLFPLTRS